MGRKGISSKYKRQVTALDNVFIIVVLSSLLVVTPFLSKLFRIPTTATEIISGMFLGGFMAHNELFDIIAEVGFLYLMFLAGLEVDLKNLIQMPKKIINKGYIYHFLIYALSICFVLLMDLSHFFILALPLISIGIVVAMMQDYKKNPLWLELSLNIGVMGELISIIALTFAAGVMKYGISFEFIKTMLSLLVVLGVSLLLFRIFSIIFWWFPEIKVLLMPYSDTKGQDLRLSFAFFFVIIAVMMYLDLELVLGAFAAGIIINSFFEHKEDLPEKLSSFGFGFLVPLFFIHIGTTIKLELLTSIAIWEIVFLFIALTLIIRFISSFVFIKDLGLRGIFLFSMSQSMPLTLVIAAATVAFDAKSIDELHYLSLVIASVLGVIIHSVFIKLLGTKKRDLKANVRKERRKKKH